MRTESDALETRIVAVCCRCWGISPAECRKLQNEGQITVDDFMATLELAVYESPATCLAVLLGYMSNTTIPVPVLEWLFQDPESAKKAKKQEEFNARFEELLQMAVPVDEESRVRLEAARAALSRNEK